jgi:peptidoglycan hydrolase-like protein with peptidoglycan-binding domain
VSNSSPDSQRRTGRPIGLLVALTMVVSAVSSGATILVLGDRINSQAESVANADFSSSGPVLVSVEQRELSEAFSFRATADVSSQKDLHLTSEIQGVVTRVFLKPGGTVRAGSVPLEVQGRPVITLPGKFRAYRTIRDGDTGPDVRQLQLALRSLGYAITDRSGTFGPRTQTALSKLYRSAGWEPPYAEAAAEPEPEAEATTTPEQQSEGGPKTDPTPQVESTATAKVKRPKRTIEARPEELFLIPSLPRQVDTVATKVGQTVNGEETVLSRYTASTRLRGTVPAGRADAATIGTSVKVDIDGDSVPGKLVSNAAGDGEAATGSSGGATVTVKLNSRRDIDVDRSYKVTVEGEHTEGPVLAVPLTAVNERPDGTAFVSVPGGQGKFADVGVTPGIQADGWIEITPLDPGALDSGVSVAVGGEVTR